MTIKIAGIGPRKITQDGIALVTHVATQLAQLGFHMNSGHGEGADQAWAAPFPDSQKTIYIPWWGFNSAIPDDTTVFQLANPSPIFRELAARYHPNWGKLAGSAQALMIRNVSILASGKDEIPVEAVVYWQEPHISIKAVGGTQHALRVAQHLEIPCFNINTEIGQVALDAWVRGALDKLTVRT